MSLGARGLKTPPTELNKSWSKLGASGHPVRAKPVGAHGFHSPGCAGIRLHKSSKQLAIDHADVVECIHLLLTVHTGALAELHGVPREAAEEHLGLVVPKFGDPSDWSHATHAISSRVDLRGGLRRNGDEHTL